MRNQPSNDPRDLLVKAAMRDAVTLGSILEGEFRSTYDGPNKAAYLAALRSWLGDLEAHDASVETPGIRAPGSSGSVRSFVGVSLRLGPVDGAGRVLGPGVDRVELEVGCAFIDEVVVHAGRDQDEPAGRDRANRP